MILWNDFKRFSSPIKLSLVLRRCSFQISFQPFLPICPVTIIRFQIQTWIVPGRCITQIIFWEMVFPNILFVFSFYLWNRDILLPMMSPEELRLLRKKDHNIICTLFGKLFKLQSLKGKIDSNIRIPVHYVLVEDVFLLDIYTYNIKVKQRWQQIQILALLYQYSYNR